MGTSNFARPENVSKYYAVLMNTEEKFIECNECDNKFYEYDDEYQQAEENRVCTCCGSDSIEWNEEYRPVEDWEVDDFKSYLREKLEEKFKGVNNSDYHDHDRNYPTSGIAMIYDNQTFCNEEIEVEFTITMTAGYYEGATLDVMIEKYINGNTIYGEFTKDDLYNTDLNEGMKELQWRNFDRKIQSMVECTIKEIEEVFEQVSTPLQRLGTFSNGESVYVGG